MNEEGSKVRGLLAKENGMHFYDIDIKPFQEKAAAVHKELEASGFIPAGLIQRIREYLAR